MIRTPNDLRKGRRILAVAGAVAMAATLAGCTSLPPDPAPTSTAGGTVTEPAPASPVESAEPTASATPTQATTPLGAMSGTWDGTWVNTTPVAATGTFTLVWAQQGDQFFGALTVEGSNCLSAGNVTGSIVDKRVSFGAVEGSTTIEYDGTVVDRDTIEGTYRSNSPECAGASGTWAAKRRTT